MKELQSLDVRAREKWRAWLGKHHASSPGVWVVFHKAHTGVQSIPYEDFVREALCFGWIDSLGFTPKRAHGSDVPGGVEPLPHGDDARSMRDYFRPGGRFGSGGGKPYSFSSRGGLTGGGSLGGGTCGGFGSCGLPLGPVGLNGGSMVIDVSPGAGRELS